MTILVTGASGFVGRHLLHEIGRHTTGPWSDMEALPVSNTHPLGRGARVDLNNKEAVMRLVDDHDITAVIHLAAEARPAVCESEPSLAVAGNVTCTRNLLEACKSKLPYFLFVSTDMVFRGDRGDYTEQDAPDATCVYGRTKIEAERLVQEYEGPWCIVRPALVYGAPIGGKVSSLSWTLNTLNSASGHFFRDEIRTPVWVEDLANLLICLTRANSRGIVHTGGPNRMSRLEFAQLTATTWGIPHSNIRVTSLVSDPVNAWRPRDVSLVSEIASALRDFTDVLSALKIIRKRSLIETEIIHKAPPAGIT